VERILPARLLEADTLPIPKIRSLSDCVRAQPANAGILQVTHTENRGKLLPDVGYGKRSV